MCFSSRKAAIPLSPHHKAKNLFHMKSYDMSSSMREHWDTIVIGAGMGGLTAAAHLVKAGLRVLVLERNPHAGGTAYVYHRKGFTFPMGPLGFSHPEFIQETLVVISDCFNPACLACLRASSINA